MEALFNKNGVKFKLPSGITVLEESWHEELSSINLDCEGTELSIDIYHKKKSKDLDSYIGSEIVHFERELPFSFSFHEAPAISPIQTNRNANNATGKQVTLNIRAFFFLKMQYSLYCYRLEFEQDLCFISCMVTDERKSLIKDSIDQILGSVKTRGRIRA